MSGLLGWQNFSTFSCWTSVGARGNCSAHTDSVEKEASATEALLKGFGECMKPRISEEAIAISHKTLFGRSVNKEALWTIVERWLDGKGEIFLGGFKLGWGWEGKLQI
jgi:hypothetical protein